MARKATGSVEYRRSKNGDGAWYGRVTAGDGSRVRIRLGDWPNSPQGRKRAVEAATHWTERIRKRGLGGVPRSEIRRRSRPGRPGGTLAEWSARWLADRRARGLTSVDADASRLEFHVCPVLGPMEMMDIKRTDVEAVVERLDQLVREGKLGWKTASHVWGLVTKLFDDACNAKERTLRVLTDNPTQGVRGPDRGVRKAKAYLYPDEFDRLMRCDEVALGFRRAVAFAIYLVPRAAELEALEWSDVDLERGIVHVHRAIDRSSDTGETKSTKTGVARRFAFEPAILPLLKVLHTERGGDERVIALGRDLARDLRKHLKRAGIKRQELFAADATRKALTFHDLRATGLTWMAIRGDEPLKIMHRAGHTNFATTQLYVREAEAVRAGFGTVFPELPASLLAAGVIKPLPGPTVRRFRRRELANELPNDRGSSINLAEAHGNRTHPTTLIAPPHRF